jgi:hypothetical protein
MDTPPRNVSRVNEFLFLLIELYKKMERLSDAPSILSIHP